MRIQSRAASDRTDFKDYSVDEMVEVLKFIADKGVKEGVLDNDILREMSEIITGDLMNDVRRGKKLIHASVQEAMREGKGKVSSAEIGAALVSVRDMTLTQILSNFGKNELLALSGYVACLNDLAEKRQPTTDSIHRYYSVNCKRRNVKPVGETMMKNYLKRLEDSKIISSESRSYGTRGRTNFYSSDYPVIELDRALMENGVFITTSNIDENAGWGTDVGELEKKKAIEEILRIRYGRE
jgi:Cdc6-like AAA superfamily ATPase